MTFNSIWGGVGYLWGKSFRKAQGEMSVTAQEEWKCHFALKKKYMIATLLWNSQNLLGQGKTYLD